MSRAARMEQAGKAFAAHLPASAVDKQVKVADYANRVEVSWAEPDPEDSKRIVRYLATNTAKEGEKWAIRGPDGVSFVIDDAATWLQQRAAMTPPAADVNLAEVARCPGKRRGPKVTPADIEGEIVGEYYASGAGAFSNNTMPTAHTQALNVMTLCVLVPRNGCKVVGINHGPVDPAGFDFDHGRKDAREDAIRQVWPLLGFRLRDRLQDAQWPKGIVRAEAEAQTLTESPQGYAGLHPEAHEEAAPTVSAADLAEGIADAARNYYRCREDERIAQSELDRATERRRNLLTQMAQATQEREKAAEKLLAAAAQAQGA